MRKINKNILVALVVSVSFFAKSQEIMYVNTSPVLSKALSLELGSDVGTQLGLTFEFNTPLFGEMAEGEEQYKEHRVIKLFFQGAVLSSSRFDDINGYGFSVHSGSKTYFNKKDYKGFYFANYSLYGQLTFDETVSGIGGYYHFKGKYRYYSFFSPELGYKLLLLDDKLALDLHLGTTWLIEFKGKGDVDNKSFNNWHFKAGLSLGYI